MLTLTKNVVQYRELITVLARKNITLRYKQAYLGIAWAVLKPIMMVLIFTIMRTFVGIESGNVPYPILTFAALMPWVLFQEAASDGVNSVVGNANLIRKVYFPREVFPITSVVTKTVEFGINLAILAVLMAWYRLAPTVQVLWLPLLLVYTLLAALVLALAGAAINVYYRDVSAALPVVLSLMMYLSPVIYPLNLVHQKLVVQQAAGDWSNALYALYVLNPLAGIIDSFQRTLLKGLPPDWAVVWPSLLLTLVLLPLAYLYFKRAESYFADVV
jgi:lipopolysaccharide transport system permease protein